MKNLLVAVVALVMTSAFAHEGNHRNMVTFSGFNDAGASETFDLSYTENENDQNDTNIALNYTYAITGTWMVGASYLNTKTNDTNESGYGVHGYYNLDGRTHDTCYVGLAYAVKENAAETKTRDINVSYGHRFSVGMWKDLHLQFSPSVSYNMSNEEPETGEEIDTNSIAWNFIKFDLLF